MKKIIITTAMVIFLTAFASACTFQENEMGNNFDSAQYINQPSCLNSEMIINGEILTEDDVDVYKIEGPFLVGDVLTVEVNPSGSNLDPAAGVFDGNQDKLFINDNRNYYIGQKESYVSFSLRTSGSFLYIAVDSSPRASTIGNYQVKINKISSTAPGYKPERVFLDFDGALQVSIEGYSSPVDIPPFEESLSSQYVAYAEQMKDIIMQKMREDYEDLDIEFYSSDDGLPSGPYSTLHFGGYSPTVLGIADNVDSYNVEQNSQDAIIFVETFFSADAFGPFNASTIEMATAFGNTASHEMGHLLGLHHTADPLEIMDQTAVLRQMLSSQYFKDSPLNNDAFSIGKQNSPQLLLWTLGPKLIPQTCDEAGYTRIGKVMLTTQDGIPADGLYDSGDQACGLAKCYGLEENWKDYPYWGAPHPDRWNIASAPPTCEDMFFTETVNLYYKALCYCAPTECASGSDSTYFPAPITTQYYTGEIDGTSMQDFLYNGDDPIMTGDEACGAAECEFVQKGEFIPEWYGDGSFSRYVWNWTRTTLPCNSSVTPPIYAYRAQCHLNLCANRPGVKPRLPPAPGVLPVIQP